MKDYIPFIILASTPLFIALAYALNEFARWVSNKVDWLLHRKEYEQNEKELAELIGRLMQDGWDTSNIKASYASIDNLQVTYLNYPHRERNEDEDSN